MEEPKSRSIPGYRWATVIAGIVLLILYACLMLFAAAAGILPGTKAALPLLGKPSSTPTATSTAQIPATSTVQVPAISTPHILVHMPPNPMMVSSNDFTDGVGAWDLLYDDAKLEEIDGQLALQANVAYHGAVAVNDNFMGPGSQYYVQADFGTDIRPLGPYGLIFGADGQTATGYVFLISPYEGRGSLSRLTDGHWKELGATMPLRLDPYPQSNTLSAYYDRGQIEIYLNGDPVLSCTDGEPFHSVGVGVYMENQGYKLLVDNFFGYSLK